jgi:5-methylcytosine-specific restriction endonuclease McrA
MPYRIKSITNICCMCGSEFHPRSDRKQSVICSSACSTSYTKSKAQSKKITYKQNVLRLELSGYRTCFLCGKQKRYVNGMKPQGQYCCHACRSINPVPYGTKREDKQCPECFKSFNKPGKQLCCSMKCAQIRRFKLRTKPLDANYVLAKNAPGLKQGQRRALLKQWIAQNRSCFYCDDKPNSIDHVIPLSRGGTNHEGNLVPACRRCNSSKNKLLLAEWRSKKKS